MGLGCLKCGGRYGPVRCRVEQGNMEHDRWKVSVLTEQMLCVGTSLRKYVRLNLIMRRQQPCQGSATTMTC